MDEFVEIIQTSGQVLAVVAAGLLCFVGIVLSCLSISGTWLVLVAAIILAVALQSSMPGIITIIVFIVLCVVVEFLEFISGWLGITKRGGSKLAGLMAVLGGFVGMAVGTLIPIPVIGSLIGMLGGSFAMAFIVEQRRLEKSGEAANIAWGAVISRLLVVMLKVCVTLGMVVALVLQVILGD